MKNTWNQHNILRIPKDSENFWVPILLRWSILPDLLASPGTQWAQRFCDASLTSPASPTSKSIRRTFSNRHDLEETNRKEFYSMHFYATSGKRPGQFMSIWALENIRRSTWSSLPNYGGPPIAKPTKVYIVMYIHKIIIYLYRYRIFGKPVEHGVELVDYADWDPLGRPCLSHLELHRPPRSFPAKATPLPEMICPTQLN